MNRVQSPALTTGPQGIVTVPAIPALPLRGTAGKA